MEIGTTAYRMNALLTLAFLRIVRNVDNILFNYIVYKKLPKEPLNVENTSTKAIATLQHASFYW